MEVFWEAFGEPWTFENHAKVYNYMHFQGLDPCGAESVSGSAFGRGLACVFRDLGADRGTHWGSFWPLLAALSGSDFAGGFGMAKKKELKVVEVGGAGGRGGASRLCLWQNSGRGSTRLAPCRRHGAADIYIYIYIYIY